MTEAVKPAISFRHPAVPYLYSRIAVQAGTKSYRLVTEAHMGTTCLGGYPKSRWSGIEPATCWSQVQHPYHNATMNLELLAEWELRIKKINLILNNYSSFLDVRRESWVLLRDANPGQMPPGQTPPVRRLPVICPPPRDQTPPSSIATSGLKPPRSIAPSGQTPPTPYPLKIVRWRCWVIT